MRKGLEWLEWCISRLGFSLLLLMSFVIGLQVIMRYVVGNALMWPEELTRYCYLWCSMCAVAACSGKRAHLRIDVIRNLAGPRLRLAFDVIASGVSIGFYLVFIWLSMDMLLMVHDMEQYAVSFDLPMTYVWAAFPLFGTATLIFIIARFTSFFSRRAAKET